jgi:hypothetical protein
MNKKRWALLILVILLLAGYYKLFYKTWSNEGVVKNADCIIALDVKRITNTLIWNFITTPSQWKSSDLFSSSLDDKVSWDDMISLPDYVFVFHKAGQPDNAFYAVVQVNDKEDFEKGLKQFHFEKTTAGSYVSKEAGIELVQSENKLLLGNAAVEDKKYFLQVADELFNKKEFIAKDSLKNYTSANNHLFAMVPFNQNSFSGSGNIFITGNFNKNSIIFSASLQPKPGINFITNQFKYSDSSLCSVGCTQPWPDVKKLLPGSSWSNISKAVNFNIDSLLLQSNHCYQLDVAGIYPRTDSAISYTYDNDFNPVEKVVVNKVEEPAFNFTVNGDSVSNIYSYWNNSGKIEKTGDSNLFTPVPFVKSCCKIKNDKTLAITSGNYTTAAADKSIDCIFFSKLLLTKMPTSLLHYFPPDVLKAVKNIESAEATITNEKGQIIFLMRFNKKKNDLPLIEL